MMQEQFVGLTMPVFAAFGWAGEEAALKYALSQLEEFVRELHVTLPRGVQHYLPFYGLNRESQTAYLAAKENPEDDLYIAFFARPMSLEIQLAMIDEMTLSRALKAAEAQPERFLQFLKDLGSDWTLHLKQMELDDDREIRTSYQDLFKDEVAALDEETMTSLISRASFLTNEPQWVVPMLLSRRFPSEQIAAMGRTVVDVMAEQIGMMLPLFELLTGKVRAKKTKKVQARNVAATKLAEATEADVDPDKQFIFETQLKPLHIRRGFINLTPGHWDFFAQSARATTREVRVAFEERVDRESSIWRLASNDVARLVLGEAARNWLEDTFAPEDRVQLVATKQDDGEIEIVLGPA